MRFTPFRHLPAVLWKRRPIQLTFFVTRRCNARCPFCFYLNGDDRDAHRGRELTLEEIRETSRSLGSLLWLAFSGGEPYLRRDLADIAGVFYEQNRPAMMLLSTNGLLPELIRDRTEEILARCPRSTLVVKLSLDGLHADHDALRGTPGGFDRVMRTRQLLAPLLDRHPNFELGINTVMMSDNQARMDRIVDFVRGLPGIGSHTISLVRGNVAEPRCTQVDAASYRHALERLEREQGEPGASRYRFRGGRLKAAQDLLQRRLIDRTRVEGRRQIPCYAGRLNLVLDERGEVYPCEMRSSSFGNVRECGYDLSRLLRGAAARPVLESIGRGECHCTHECYFITNILFNPRLYPALAREYLALGRSAGGRAAASQAPPSIPHLSANQVWPSPAKVHKNSTGIDCARLSTPDGPIA